MPVFNAIPNIEAAMDGGQVLDVTAAQTEFVQIDVNKIVPSTGSTVTTEATIIALTGAVAVTGALGTTGGFLSTSSTAGIGYGATAGGAVTQGTGSANFTTGVTLSKPCGQITTATAATGTQGLAVGAEAVFTVTNTLVVATDVVVVSIAQQFTGAYVQAYVQSTTAGSFVIGMTNISDTAIATGAAAAKINFAIIKAVAA